jgi:hypothetical protein
VTLLRLPLGCLTWTILRLAILAAALVAGYLLVVRPLLEDAGKAVRPATQRIDRIDRCLANAHGNPHRVYRCTAKF